MAEGSNNLTTYYAKRIIGDNAAASPDKALLQTGTAITSDEWILNQTARYNESPSKKYGILYNYDDNGHDVIEFWGNKPDTNNNNNPIPSVSITLDSGNTEIMGTLDVVESTLLQSTLTVNNTSLFKNTVTIQMASPTLVLDSTTSGAVDWTIKNNQGIFTIDNNNNNSLTQILGNSTKGWQIDERLYINATIPNSPNYTLYVSGKTYVSGVSYLNGQVGIGYNPETSGNTHKLYVNGTTYLTDHLYIGRTNSSHIYLINKNWTKGSIPSSQTYSALEFNSNDSANNRVALLEATLDTSGNSQFNIFLVPNIANSTSWSGIVLKKDINDVLTINISGTTTINGHLHLGAGKSIYFRYNDTDWPVLQNYNNSNITLNACGGGIHIGYINTPNTYIFYSNSSSAGTKFFEVNSNGSYALTRFGVNGQNTSYNFYVNGTSYFNGNTTHNGIDYFANGTTYYINNSAVAYFNDLRTDNVRLVDNWIGFYQNADAGGNRYGYIQANADRMYFVKENSTASLDYYFSFNSSVYSSSYFLGTSTASSWIDGQRYNRGGFNLTNATDTGSYWPWMRQTNTGSAKWFSLGVLSNSLYIMGSATSRTSNGYDYGWRFDVSNGFFYAPTGEFTRLRVINDSSNIGDDALVYIQNQTANDWALKIVKGGKDYGLRVDALDCGNAIWTNGYINCRILRANQGSNGERQIIVDSGTSGNLYMFANTGEKGIYSSSGYQTGYVIRVTSSGKTFYGALSGNADTATSASKVGAGAAAWMYFNNSNEVNFGGTSTSTSIYFGYRATDSRGKPTEFIFGSGAGTATVKASAVWGNKVLVNSDWIGFYKDSANTGTRYGFLEVTSTKYYFRKENGADTYPFDFNGNIITTGAVYAGSFVGRSGSHGYLVAGSNSHFLAMQTDCNLVIYRSGSTAVWSSNTGSSYLMKDNIRNIYKEELQNFDKLRVVNFTYKKELCIEDSGPQFGLIAEEVLSLYPYVVGVPPDYDPAKFDIKKKLQQPYLSIKYERFVPLLIKKIQLQEEEISELRAQLNAIKNQINNL